MQQQFTNSPTSKLTLCHPPYWFHAVNRLQKRFARFNPNQFRFDKWSDKKTQFQFGLANGLRPQSGKRQGRRTSRRGLGD